MTGSPFPRILAVTYGGGHAATLAPVMAALKNAGGVEIVILALTTAPRVYARHDLPTVGMAHYLGSGDEAVRQLGRELTEGVDWETSPVGRDESIAYHGFCMLDLIGDLGEGEARRRFVDVGRHAFDPVPTLERIIRTERPDLVVTTNSPKSERAAVKAANRLGIDTLMLPDMFCHPTWEMYTPYQANHYAVISSIAVKNLEKFHGISAWRATVTGQPAFDKRLVPNRAESLRYAKKLAGQRIDAGYLLVATSPDVPDDHYPAHGSRDSETAIRAICHDHGPRVPMVIKPHPSERVDAYERLTGQCPCISVVPPASDLNQLLRAAGGLIAASPSTAVIDALSLDVPTVVCSLGRPALRDVLPWNELAVPVITAQSRLADLASESFLRFVPPSQAVVRAEFARLNAGATQRVADLLRERAGRVISR